MDAIGERCNELLDQLEKLVRDCDDKLAGGYDLTPLQRQRERRRRNAVNAACNAMHRARRA